MKTFLKIIFWTFIVLLISAVVMSITYILDQPLENGLYALATIFGLWILIIAVRKLIIRLRAKAQVRNILNMGAAEEVSDDLGMTPSELRYSLRNGWGKTIRALKRSQLKLQGDPLYVLPWYMIFGRPSSGKSTSLRNARLLSPSIDLSEHKDGSTLNIEWWLHEEGIVIDTAGRYAVPDNLERDRKEWDHLLSMLSRHKQREPLNGLILVVAADRLLKAGDDELMEEGRQVRNSINRLMDRLEVKVPVYLMVTKADLIPGFAEWCNALPDDVKDQAMGYMNDSDSSDYPSLVNAALDKVLDRLKDLRLLMLEQSESLDNAVLKLPDHVENLRAGLQTFVRTALEGNAYQEAPPFRGLYFTSSLHKNDGVIVRKGTFLNDFFTRILPSDRGLLVSLPSAIRFRRAFNQFAFGISGAITFVTIVALTAAFNADRSFLSEIFTDYSGTDLSVISEKNDINHTIENLYRLKTLIDALEQYEKSSVVPWRTIGGSSSQLDALKQHYVNAVANQLLLPFDQDIKLTIDNIERANISALAGGLVRRINILQNQILGSDKKNTADSLPIGREYLTVQSPSVKSEPSSLFHEVYLAYALWNTSTVTLIDEKSKLQSALLYLIRNSHGDYSWIVQWANAQGFDNIRLKDYWGGSVAIDNPPFISSAFTLDGYEFIDSFLDEFERANTDDRQLSEVRSDFDKYYERQYVQAWMDFSERFDEGKMQQRDRQEWQNLLDRMATADNPYFRFLEDLYVQLSPFEDNQYQSRQLIEIFSEIQEYSVDDGRKGRSDSKLLKKALGKMGKVGKVAKKGMKAHSKATKGSGSDDDIDIVIDEAVKIVDSYKQTLAEIAFQSSSRTQSLDSVSSLFTNPDKPESGNGSVSSAWKTVKELQAVLGRPTSNSRLFWKFYTAPLEAAYDYMQKESSCELQTRWQNNVLSAIDSTPRNEIGKVLIGEGGLLWQYVNTEMSPFIARQYRRGYVKNNANMRSMPITSDFLDVVNRASSGAITVGNEFTVSMKALPTGVNPGARVSPYATFVDLHCSDGVQTMANYNYPTSHDFKWSLERCGDVTLRIDIGQLTLIKNYHGVKGFNNFLYDFRAGRKVFSPSDFPNQRAQLSNLKVDHIDVNYEIRGQAPVIQMRENVPLDLPKTVAYCW